MRRLAVAVMSLATLGCAAAQQGDATGKPGAPATPPTKQGIQAATGPDAPRPCATSDALLDALERATDGLRDVRATVIYDRTDAVTGDRERRTGRIVLEQATGDAASRRFGIAFDQFIDAAGHASPQRQRFAFGDGWLAEFDDARKQCIERQLVPEGRRLDPLRLGEGPMPLPVGQRAEDVRRRFTVSLAAEPEAPLLKRLEGVQGLVLVPKPGSGVEEDFREVRVWYDLRTLVPVGVVATLPGGDVKTVLLRDVCVNAGLDADARAMLDRAPPAGWRRDVRPFRASAP